MARRFSWMAAVWTLVLAWACSGVLADEPPGKANALATQPASQPGQDDEYYELFKVLADTVSQVEQNYVSEISRRELVEAAIRGVLEKLDPYSSYISPDEISRFKTSVESQFGGIGIQITMDRGQLKILSPLVGSPAYRAGLQAGDAILEIEGQKTEGISIDEAVNQLKGEAGTEVTMTVRHADGQRETVTLRREVIQIETVMGDTRKDDDSWEFMLDAEKKIGYIRITAFSRDTASRLQQAVKELSRQKVRGLILDLRFNPGGLLRSAIDVADLFIDEGLIVSTKGRNLDERKVQAKKSGTFKEFPMVVLVNRYSASASEIVSACLQDHQRAVVIGERTWGKGSVQNVIEMEGGRSALKLTTASYWRPNGKNIHRFPDAKESDEWGVSPNSGYELKLSDSEMGELVRFRRDRDILRVNHYKVPGKADDQPTGKPETTAPAKVETAAPAKPADSKPEFIDRQLQKAIEYLTTEVAKVD